jgi:branched-subunit amino acid transport protein
VSPDLLLLVGLMFAVTYASRAVPLLIPGVDRLPPWALAYLSLVGPAILASIAAASVLVVPGEDGGQAIHLGIEALAVAVCAALVTWRRNLFVGLAGAVAIVVALRFAGLG